MLTLYVLAPTTHAQSPRFSDRATVEGIVRDSHQRPVASVTVQLQSNSDQQSVSTRTDSNGKFEFSALREGSYSVRAEVLGKGRAIVSPVVLRQNETRTLELMLSMEEPTFFDEPSFSVAGVTDTTSLGGHGSDTVVRTKDALAKATVSLSAGSGSTSAPPAIGGESEEGLRAMVARNPDSFEANYGLGALLVKEGKAGEAIPYLERASRIQPDDYGNGYQLASARAAVEDYQKARDEVQALLTKRETPELHHLMGDVAEKMGDPLAAVREYQRAAQLNPSEQNLFDWGTELLMHYAPEPAAEVFGNAHRSFPRSTRILLGLGVAWFTHGSYDQAVEYLGEASDLMPDDPNPYMFLGKIQSLVASESDGIAERLARFARLQPKNAFAEYYYAVSLWHRRKGPDDAQTVSQVESLLKTAVALDPQLAEAYLQIGIVYSEQREFPRALSAYQQAVVVDPRMEQAHYRLAQTYRLTGQKDKVQSELRLYQQISKEKAAQADRERSDIKQFVYTLREQANTARP